MHINDWTTIDYNSTKVEINTEYIKTLTWLLDSNMFDIFWIDTVNVLPASLTQVFLSSHLCIFSKEPVLVTTLHSQQRILMLLFQLDDLLFQGSVHAL